MRWLVLAGSVVFAYLALFPGGLVISTIDSACAGPDCDQPLAEDILLGVLYGLCFAAVVACSATMVLYFFRTTVSGERLIRRALVARARDRPGRPSSPSSRSSSRSPRSSRWRRAAPSTGRFGSATGPSAEPEPPDPSSNGHGKLNGHPG